MFGREKKTKQNTDKRDVETCLLWQAWKLFLVKYSFDELSAMVLLHVKLCLKHYSSIKVF